MRKMYSRLESVRYELFLFLVLAYELCRFAPDVGGMNAWVTTPYTLSYRFGFGSRFLIGSVIDLFTDRLSATLLWCVIFAVCLVLIGLTSLVLGRVIRKSEDALRPFAITAAALFLASPASVSYLYSGAMFGRLETYHLLLVTVALCVLRRKTLKWIIPVLCVLCVAIHQFFVFTFAPLLFVTLLYEMAHAKFSKESVLLFALSALALTASFLAFQFFSGNLTVSSADEMMAEIAGYSNVPVLRTMLQLEYFSPLAQATTATSIPAHPRLLLYSAGTLLLLSPLIVLLYSFWFQCRKAAADKGKKAIYTLMLFFPLLFIPAFYLTVDWGRYLAPIFISNFALIFYLVYHREPDALQTAQAAVTRYQRGWPKLLMLAVYLTALGKINGNAALDLVARVLETLERVLQKLF